MGPVAEAAGSAHEIFAGGPCCLAPLSALTFVVILVVIIGTRKQLLAARLESQAWRLTSRTPLPPAPYLLRSKVKKYWTLGMKAATGLLLTLRLCPQISSSRLFVLVRKRRMELILDNLSTA
ncbi:hypothetical protein KUCAC02_036277 [Chaenocephalus aceratus]|nr:hypothetical protein KUCAC02_036277 [Chaenocephalus aceratus]